MLSQKPLFMPLESVFFDLTRSLNSSLQLWVHLLQNSYPEGVSCIMFRLLCSVMSTISRTVDRTVDVFTSF